MTERRRSIVKTLVAGAFAFAAGLAVTYAATDGFAAYTLESARRLAAQRSPKAIRGTLLELSDGRRQELTALDAPILLVDFIYTRCLAYCTVLGATNAQLQRELAPEIAAGRVRLLSVSFDPAWDGREQLQAYRARYSSDERGWDMARPADAAALPALLAEFGVVVIPDELGGFAHNAAYHVVGPDRKLVAILDSDDISGVTAAVRQRLEQQVRDAELH